MHPPGMILVGRAATRRENKPVAVPDNDKYRFDLLVCIFKMHPPGMILVGRAATRRENKPVAAPENGRHRFDLLGRCVEYL